MIPFTYLSRAVITSLLLFKTFRMFYIKLTRTKLRTKKRENE